METIKAMAEEGTLFDDETMDEVLTERQAIDHMETAYTSIIL